MPSILRGFFFPRLILIFLTCVPPAGIVLVVLYDSGVTVNGGDMMEASEEESFGRMNKMEQPRTNCKEVFSFADDLSMNEINECMGSELFLSS